MKKNKMYPGVKTWNPISGKCPHDCKYCAVQKMFNRKLPGAIAKYSGELRLNEKEMKRNLGSGNTWFISGVGNDLFAKGVNVEWIERILEHCDKYPDNTYMLQTKDTEVMNDYFKLREIPKNYYLGTTIETDNDNLCLKYSGGDYPERRAYWLSKINHILKYVTIEPIMKFDLLELINIIKIVMPEIVFIGFNSYSKIQLSEPTKEETELLISELRKFTTVKIK